MEPKSRLVYIILALFLGGFGVHNFYAGYTRNAVIQLLLTLLLGWTGIVALVILIWVIIDIIQVTNDASGVPMK